MAHTAIPVSITVHVPLSSEKVLLIGRSGECGMKIDDASVSRVQCRVMVHDGRVLLYDAGSRWGTFVNDKRISECSLHHGDRIKVGETTLQLTNDQSTDYPFLSLLSLPADSRPMDPATAALREVVPQNGSRDRRLRSAP